MGSSNYSQPESTQNVPVKVPELPLVQTKKDTKPAQETSKTLEAEGGVVLVSQMINAKSNAVSNVFTQAIDRYIALLTGELNVGADKIADEQISFMNTLSNTLNLGYEDYVLVTDHLVKRLAEKRDVVNELNMFQFIPRLGANTFSKSALDRYKQYFMALVTLSRNLAQRDRIGRLIDIATLAKGYKPKAVSNITQYFQRNYS